MTSQPNLPKSKQSWVKFKVSNAYLEIVLPTGISKKAVTISYLLTCILGQKANS